MEDTQRVLIGLIKHYLEAIDLLNNLYQDTGNEELVELVNHMNSIDVSIETNNIH